jgi:hypothetical protein
MQQHLHKRKELPMKCLLIIATLAVAVAVAIFEPRQLGAEEAAITTAVRPPKIGLAQGGAGFEIFLPQGMTAEVEAYPAHIKSGAEVAIGLLVQDRKCEHALAVNNYVVSEWSGMPPEGGQCKVVAEKPTLLYLHAKIKPGGYGRGEWQQAGIVLKVLDEQDRVAKFGVDTTGGAGAGTYTGAIITIRW